MSLWLSLLSTCSWVCGESIHLIGSMSLSSSPPVAGVWWAHTLDCLYVSLSSPPVAGVWVSAYTWLSLCLSLLSTCSWCVVRAYTWLALWLSLLSTCSWCVVSAYTWLALWLSLLSTCSWCVVRAYTWWLYDSLSSPPVAGVWWEHTLDWLYVSLLLSTCSWCVVRAYTWLALCLSLLSTCSWCVVRAYTWLALCLSLLSTCSWCVGESVHLIGSMSLSPLHL